MKIIVAFFASRRYWNDEEQRQQAYRRLAERMRCMSSESVLIAEEADLQRLPASCDCLIAVPMSGAVQRLMLAAAKTAATVLVFPAYVRGNAEADLEEAMLQRNAAPTTMDCWAVLKRTHPHALLALTMDDAARKLRVFRAYTAMQGATLLLIGDTEPWVVSNSAELASYQRLGVRILRVAQAEVAALYRDMRDDEAKTYYQYFKGDEQAIVEPTESDLRAAARMAAALERIVKQYSADGMALACFNLLAEGTNCCLGVSYLNDCTPFVAACEGDVDSAVTMLAMKHIASSKLWMANPGLHPDGTINFSHCTAPLNLCGAGKCPYTLRNHHESGIGVSLEVTYPIGSTITACRISDEARCMTVQKGIVVSGEYERACRTQVYVRFDDVQRYLDTVLGCHQVFAFEDVADEMRLLGAQLGLTMPD